LLHLLFVLTGIPHFEYQPSHLGRNCHRRVRY
jgi:hypothetical protein